jgi:hypothetical protein
MIPDLMYKGDTLYTRIKKASKTYPSANITAAGGTTRPAFRVPMRIQSGAAITQGTGNGDSLGRGTGSLWVSGDISPVFLFSGCEITYLSEIATSGPKRGMVSVRAQELKNSLTSFLNGIEALAQGDSSGMLDQIPTTATITTGGSGAQTSSIAGLNNANQFQDQQVVQFFPSEGGTVRGSGGTATATVSYVDGITNTVYFSTALPSGVATGDYITINLQVASGTGAAAGASVAGIKTYQVNGNTGTVLGLARSSYPSRLSTPTINLNGKPVSPSVAFRAHIQIKRGLGMDTEASKELVWYCGPDQALAITNLYLNVLGQNNASDLSKAKDITPSNLVSTFGGKEVVESYNATPGRIDGLCLGNWGIVEMVEPSLYSFGNGVTTMPVPDPNGAGYLSSNIFYYNAALNFFNSNMKAGIYIQNAAIPTI